MKQTTCDADSLFSLNLKCPNHGLHDHSRFTNIVVDATDGKVCPHSVAHNIWRLRLPQNSIGNPEKAWRSYLRLCLAACDFTKVHKTLYRA